MKVITPTAVAEHTGSKYLGVLVAAKYARTLNEFRRGEVYEEPAAGTELPEKLTTISLDLVARGKVAFDLVERRNPDL
jgi:DNA-directed RNA polymerase omega subunit